MHCRQAVFRTCEHSFVSFFNKSFQKFLKLSCAPSKNSHVLHLKLSHWLKSTIVQVFSYNISTKISLFLCLLAHVVAASSLCREHHKITMLLTMLYMWGFFNCEVIPNTFLSQFCRKSQNYVELFTL